MINSNLTHTITIHKTTSSDQLNRPQPTTTQTHNAHINWKTKKITDKKGDHIISTATITLQHTPDLQHQDQIEIQGRTHEIIEIKHPSTLSYQITEVNIK